MGRRPRFSQSEVEDAALAVVDRAGATGLTMRAVAEELGTGPMTLYTYVEDRAGLDALVVDAVTRRVTLPEHPGEGDWREEVTAIAESVWRAVRDHPHAIPLVLARRSRSATFLDVAEALLAALARSGREGSDLLVAFRAVTTFATAFALTELAGPVSAAGEDPAEVVERFRALPTDRYPRLVEIAGAARSSTPDDEFRRGLAALLDGLDPVGRGPGPGR
ncbi:MAG TPA: TetR/AcrR family transcriptional regulator C-terminal domain-containing protein [Acidimicrobiales bacterium]